MQFQNYIDSVTSADHTPVADACFFLAPGRALFRDVMTREGVVK